MNKCAWFAVSLLLFALPVAAEVQRTTGEVDGKPYVEMTSHRIMTGTIIAIDMATREVKVLNAAGDTLTAVAGPEVKNLAKVQVKDVVKINIREYARIEIVTGPAVRDTQEVSVMSAKPGEQPHATVTKRSRSTASIVKIDKGTSTVTLKGQDGNTFTAKAQHKENLDKVKVGDLVLFTITKSVATSVAKAGAK